MAPFRGRTVLETVIQTAKAISERVFIVANELSPYEDFGIPVVKDLTPGLGPLAGLQTALYHCQSERIFYLACDMPLVSPELMAWMAGIETRASVVIPEGPKGLEPLHAIYRKELLALVEERLKTSRLSIRALVRDVPHLVVSRKEVERFCPGLWCLKSANTPEELEKLKAERSKLKGGR